MISPPKTAKAPWVLALISPAIFVCLYSALYFFYSSQHTKIKSAVHNELSIIADQKVLQISNWRQERIRDIQLFAGTTGFAEYVRTRGNGQLKKELLTLMHSARKLQGYHNLMIADSRGLLRLSSIEESWTPPKPELIQKALTGGLPVLGDLTRQSGSGAIYLEIIAPLLQTDRSLTPAGLMVARIDPYQFFSPFLQSWPSSSRTAETVLVRREGDAIIYLNELRHRKNTALSFRESSKNKDLLSARLLRGGTGAAEGLDYRGEPVLAEVRTVPDTPWLMVAKVDADEIFAPLRLQAITVCAVLGLLLLGAAMFVWGFWSRRQAAELARTAQFDTGGSIRQMSSEGWMVSDGAGAPILAGGIVQDITERKVIEKELNRHRDNLEELVRQRTAALEKEMAERKKTEEELRASESRFKGLVANIPGVVYRVFCDHERPITDWTIEYVSSSAEQLAGRPVSYFEGNTVGLYTSLIHAGDAETVARKLAESISLNQPYSLEYRILHSDGSYRWVMSRGQAFKDTNGMVLWLDGVILDITERRQAEQTLRESEERFRAIAESTPDAILVTDADYNILYWNNGAAGMFGYAADEVIGKSHAFLLPPLQQQQEQQAVSVFRDSGRLASEGTAFETVAVKKDGTVFPMELSIAFWEMAEKKYYGVIIRDCTQRKKADEALRQSEEQFRAFAETCPDAVIITDITMTILYWNTAAEKIFGYSREEMLGRQPDCLMCPAALARQAKALENLLETGHSSFLDGFTETTALTKQGVEFPCELAVFQWETAGRFFLGVILRDITARKKMQAEALKAAHLASIGELAAGVAHEINNPINGIINCADILKHQFEKKGEDGDIPGRIIKEGERVARIVKNLLTFAREQKGKMEPHNISAIYSDAYALLSKQFEKDFILIRLDVPENLPEVMAQPQQIQQVFINLLSNARYALNKKYPDKDPCKQLDIQAQPIVVEDRQYVRIIFHDRGTGVSESHIEKLGNPFFTTKPAGEGTGLGLSISHNIIQDHSGRMLFESREGEYMRVMVDLPAVVNERS